MTNGNDLEALIKALRSTGSRSKRKLLDEAADTIEALLSDLQLANNTDGCATCAHNGVECVSDNCDCDSCKEPCPCKLCCTGGDNWEWRGVQRKEAEKMKK